RRSGTACRIMGFTSDGNGGTGRRGVAARVPAFGDDDGRPEAAWPQDPPRTRFTAASFASGLSSPDHLAVRIQHPDVAEIEFAYRFLDRVEIADHDPGQGLRTDDRACGRVHRGGVERLDALASGAH